MRYAVISANDKLICFDHTDQVAEYCMEKNNGYLENYLEDQEQSSESMTPVELGYIYAQVGAENGEPRIYETCAIIKNMKENDMGEDVVEAAKELFNNRRLNQEMDCPGYIQDSVAELTPIDVSEISGHVYTAQTIDSSSETRGNSGI